MSLRQLVALIVLLGSFDPCHADDGLRMLRQLRSLQKVVIVRAEVVGAEGQSQSFRMIDSQKVSHFALRTLRIKEIAWSDFSREDEDKAFFGKGFRLIRAGGAVPVYDKAVMINGDQLAPLHLKKGQVRIYVLTRSSSIKGGMVPVALAEIDEEALIGFLGEIRE